MDKRVANESEMDELLDVNPFHTKLPVLSLGEYERNVSMVQQLFAKAPSAYVPNAPSWWRQFRHTLPSMFQGPLLPPDNMFYKVEENFPKFNVAFLGQHGVGKSKRWIIARYVLLAISNK